MKNRTNPPLPRRLTALAMATLVTFALPGTPASAAVNGYNVVPHTAADVTADALPTTQIDGIAWDQVIVGNTVYVGGEFANARPAGAAPGTRLTPRSNLLAYDVTTGVLKTTFAPVVNGKVRTVAVSPDRTKLYIGGNFTKVNGQTRNRVAAFNLSDGSLDTGFKPSVNSEVSSIVATDTTVYIGGVFSAVNGVPRSRLAAASRSGRLMAWAPAADLYVNSIALTPDASKLAVGGSFSAINGSFAPGLAFVDSVSGALLPFAANQVVQNHGPSSGIYSVKNDGKNILATGWWYAGQGNFEGILSASPSDGSIRWMADCHGDSYDATTLGGTTYTVSHHHYCGNMGSFEEQNPRYFERAQAFTDRATGTTLHDKQGYFDFHGQPSPSRVGWAPDLDAGNVSGSWQAAWTIESDDRYVVLGGEFPRVNGQAQQGLVRFAVPALAPNTSGPKYTWNWNPTATVIGTTAKVTWPSNVDRDDLELTYRLYRDDRPGTPLMTRTGSSSWFDRPVLGHLDGTLVEGRTYSYWVTATDPDGNVASSQRVTVTAGDNAIPATAYSQMVEADGAEHYWRLLENPGSATSIDWREGNDLRLGSGVTLGEPGAVGDGSVDSAAAFDGTDAGRGVMGTAELAPDTFSAELWFNTTSTAGGKLLGFGASDTGDSLYHDRNLYMGTDGRLHFGVWDGSAKVVSTSAAYNDGRFHHVVASLSPAGMVLWVDGRVVAADATTTRGQQDLRGYWHVGGDNLSGWPNAGATGNFQGVIDEVAIYPAALTTDAVRAHYTAAGRTLALPAQPSDAYGKVVIADEPQFLWRLDETRTPTVVDATTNLNNGTWFGSPTLRVPSPVTGTNGTGVSLDGSAAGIAQDARVAGPQVFSVESWFRTSSTTGGKIIGFGNQHSGLSTQYDRHVWMDPSGQVRFGAYNQGMQSVSSSRPYNDGQWHHVVGSMGPNGMQLFLDGELVGSNGNTRAEDFSGFWRVGGDSSWSGSPWFTGQLDETAVYHGVLSADQVRAHYRASAAAQNQKPVAAFTVSCEGDTCTFDASGSTDPDGVVGSWTWDFGDGTRAQGRTATRTFTAQQPQQVTLTVTDDQQATASTTQTVDVAVQNKAPVADIAATCDGLTCTFDSAGSTDADGTIVSTTWDFGDGATSTAAAPEHTYAAAGSHTVTLTVVDDRGASARTTQVVTVDAQNAMPTAAFTSTVQDLQVRFDASTSTDSDGTIARHEWDFGDGTRGTGAAATHTYTEAGTYAVVLTVTDDKGARATRTEQVTVAAATNQPPKAAFEAVVTDRQVALDASTSNDPDGRIVSHQWNFGDGTTGTGAITTHDYGAAGSYTVTLTVTDDKGETSTSSRAVLVADKPNQAPTAAFTHTVDQLTAQVDASTSTDPDGSIATYAWDFGDGQTATGRSVQHVYAQVGEHTVTLTVTDDAGAKATSTATVTTTAQAAAGLPVAQDAFGQVETRWGTADVGGAWSYPIAPTLFRTDGQTGLVQVPAGGTARAVLTDAQVLDSTLEATLAVDRRTTGSGLYSQLVSRHGADGHYGLGVRWLPTGQVNLILYRTVNGSAVALKETAVSGLTYEAGTQLRVRFDVRGQGTSHLSGMIWAKGQSAPAEPQISLVDSTPALQRAGAPGINTYLSGSATNGPVTLSMDDLVVTKD
ncbi:PKD domain-containing protein [Luteococcus sp. Sow4_B9]|uniref:PKD domain-containing protein n=1 Tax=Luteococcus sp. Sow4_B9 TaxID=3438792 RepID=UPI003F9E216D